ncbi:gliding motility lipoprotein GldD [Flavobacterium urocaniciphilum]|uniref:Protein involved in gliding motility GldD n=1 Tax=Flavobacterium urocaniciphilum TaxID=1299341 RepID=A0A1H9CFX1_9FLAO|nr:gliding motility lipoprotein GldD [Flavobacterium urocaniciphilum]SEQ00130.1 protein involved in gliding motility GldD [Flavobacterium urocaniciphilum]
MKKNLFFTLLSIALLSCGDEKMPKPKGQLSLEYPPAKYQKFSNSCGFDFEKNELTTVKATSNCGLEIHYPKMKATVYLTYKPVQNNLEKLLVDAQKLTYEHVIKANDIAEQPYINANDKVYGMFYQVGGNAATNAQFYVTDSTRNFVTASMYFYSKPNFDSILPAADYIKNDMKKMIETIRWK